MLLDINTRTVLSGPSASTDNAIARWDGVTGTKLQDSNVIIDDSNNVTIPGQIDQDYITGSYTSSIGIDVDILTPIGSGVGDTTVYGIDLLVKSREDINNGNSNRAECYGASFVSRNETLFTGNSDYCSRYNAGLLVSTFDSDDGRNDTASGSNYVNFWGIYNTVNLRRGLDNASGIQTVKAYGIYNKVKAGGTEIAGTLNKTIYGHYINFESGVSVANGTINQYGLYIKKGFDGDTNYSIYDDTGWNVYIKGQLGIGNTSPSGALDVNGNIITSGNITASGGNSIEWTLAYNHSINNSQAHSDYLLNNNDDETTGTLIAANFTTTGYVSGATLYVTNIITSGNITLSAGTSINEFSTDGTLAGNSDDAVPTEKAVKTYAAPLDAPTFTTSITIPETAGISDYDKFLVSDSGVIKYRSGVEVLSDIGAAPSGTAVTADLVIADHTIVRGDGGGRGVQDSGITIDDNDKLTIPGQIDQNYSPTGGEGNIGFDLSAVTSEGSGASSVSILGNKVVVDQRVDIDDGSYAISLCQGQTIDATNQTLFTGTTGDPPSICTRWTIGLENTVVESEEVDTASGDNRSTIHGLYNVVKAQRDLNNAAGSLDVVVYGVDSHLYAKGEEVAGTLDKTLYGERIIFDAGESVSNGVITQYGLFIGKNFDGDVNYSIYDNSGWDAYIKGQLGINNTSPGEALDVTGNIVASGTVTGVPRGAFHVHRNGTNQTIVKDTNTLVQWTTEDFDDDSWFSTAGGEYWFKPQVEGKYMLACNVWMGVLADGVGMNLQLWKNGAMYKSLGNVKVGGSAISGCGSSVVVAANGSTDYFQIYVFHADPAGNKTLYGATTASFFSGVKL